MKSRRWIRSGWAGSAQADRHVGLAHGQIQLLVGEDQLHAHIRVKVEEFGDALGQPDRAEADRRRHLQLARGTLAGLDEARLGRFQPHAHVPGGPEQQVALLGQDQPAGMTVEEGSLQLALEGADLTAHGGLAQAQIVTGPREAARFCDRIENPDLVPVHGVPLMPRMLLMQGFFYLL